jgi:SulP family sulfate permease
MYNGLLSPASPAPPSRNDERTPLLSSPLPTFPIYIPARPPTPCKPKNKPSLNLLATKISHGLKQATSKDSIEGFVKTSVKSLPAVLLGTLLNILDGVSYGMIIFPAAGIFADLGGMGVSLFFVSAVIAQLVYTLGGSGFAGANGSMMIEVVPFFHIIASTIARDIGEDKPQKVIATTLVAFAMSSVLTGLSFFLLGALRLGALIGFFPRHILVGCIGGVGAFLIETGLTVSTRISDDDFSYTLSTLKFMCEPHNLVLWLPALGLAVLLRVITHKFHHQLIFPLYFIVIPMVFYIVVAAAQLDLGVLRQTGWLFDMGNSGKRSWYEFYTYYDVGKVQFDAIWATLPTQFALLFFNILHPPLNVPALGENVVLYCFRSCS